MMFGIKLDRTFRVSDLVSILLILAAIVSSFGSIQVKLAKVDELSVVTEQMRREQQQMKELLARMGAILEQMEKNK